MRESDILILIIYLLCITGVYYEALNSLENFIAISLDKAFLEQQLIGQELKDIIKIEFDIKVKLIEELKEISLSIANASSNQAFYVDWDQCVINDFGRRSRRVIRLVPGMTLDLLQPQAFSTIAPGQTLKEKVIAEDCLARGSTNIEITKSLLDAKGLGDAFKKGEPRFSLVLVLYRASRQATVPCVLACQFTIRKKTWQEAVTWKPKPYKKKEGK